jgi:Outer membrane efflux protein
VGELLSLREGEWGAASARRPRGFEVGLELRDQRALLVAERVYANNVEARRASGVEPFYERLTEETETASSRYANEIERRAALESARDAELATGITRAQLREGRADSLAVLDAERTLAIAEADLAEADARIADCQVDLFRAFSGGGWQT